MLICGACGGLVKSLSDLAVHLRCEEKPLPLVEVENTSTNTGSPKLCRSCLKLYACVRSGNDVSGCGEFVWTAA